MRFTLCVTRKMIGVFDSGYGGLTILKSFIEVLPEYDYIYLGDNSRAPYGSKSPGTIYRYSCEAVNYLFSQGCELIIIACNTVSAVALRKIQQEFAAERFPDKKVLGIVIPIAEVVAEQEAKKIGIICTQATLESRIYEIELKKLKTDFELYEQACPLLVPLIEEGWMKKIETRMILKRYLRPLKAKHPDLLLLGCTHYSFLYDEIKSIMGRRTKVIDPPRIVAGKLQDYLVRQNEIEAAIQKGAKRICLTTGDKKKFNNFTKSFLKNEKNSVDRLELERLLIKDK